MDTVNTTPETPRRFPKINFGHIGGLLASGAKSTGENFNSFSGFMGGLDRTLSKTLDPVVRDKHVRFGYLVISVIVLQSCIAGSAWSELMHSISVGIAVFIAWIIVFSAMDSLMMELMNRELAKTRTYSIGSIAARIIIIGFTSYLNSTMAEMRIFDGEIKKSIYDFRQAEFQALSDTTAIRVDSLQDAKQPFQKVVDEKNLAFAKWLNGEISKIDAKKSEVTARETDLVKEIEGSAGSGKRGDGDVAKAKRVAIDQANQALRDETASLDLSKETRPEYLALQSALDEQKKQVERIDAQIAKEEKNLEQKKAEISKLRDDGFLDRYHALERVGADNWLVRIVWAFFFFLELSILIFKVTMMSRDEYHDILLNHLNTVFKEKILAQKEDLETAISAHENALDQILLNRVNTRIQNEGDLNSKELALYPIEEKRIKDQLGHAANITDMMDQKISDPSVRSHFKFDWLRKFLKLKPEQVN